jgi:hypothetical protein
MVLKMKQTTTSGRQQTSEITPREPIRNKAIDKVNNLGPSSS